MPVRACHSRNAPGGLGVTIGLMMQLSILAIHGDAARFQKETANFAYGVKLAVPYK